MKALALIALVGCGVPALQLDFHIDNASDQSCHTDNCEDISISCGAIESIRIFDPAHPSAPYLSQCQVIPQTKTKSLCSIVQNKLDQSFELPVQTLAVEVVVYPASAIPKDADGNLICPTEAEGLEFDLVTGMPKGTIAMKDPINPAMTLPAFHPSIGGRAFWHPGDDDVLVTLGCNDVAQLSSCQMNQEVNTKVHVLDFDNNISVSKPAGEEIVVGIGEPTNVPGGTDVQFELKPGNTTQLDRSDDAIPLWTADLTQVFDDPYCVEVIDQGQVQITPTLTCFPTIGATSITADAYRMSNDKLMKILVGFYGPTLANVPADGLTIGVVYRDNTPAAGKVVHAETPNQMPATLHYLDADYVDRGATATSAVGIFIAETKDNVPFGTTFSTTSDTSMKTVTAIGGNVQHKITLVVLPYTTPGKG